MFFLSEERGALGARRVFEYNICLVCGVVINSIAFDDTVDFISGFLLKIVVVRPSHNSKGMTNRISILQKMTCSSKEPSMFPNAIHSKPNSPFFPAPPEGCSKLFGYSFCVVQNPSKSNRF